MICIVYLILGQPNKLGIIIFTLKILNVRLREVFLLMVTCSRVYSFKL